MTEQRIEYNGEMPEDMQHEIRDEAPRDHYSSIPNLVDDLNLTPQAYRLYGHLRRVAGENGKCWQSTKTLSKSCRMSAGSISEAKKELENTFPPLIRVTSKTKEGGIYHEITITDIWDINHKFYNGISVHIVKSPDQRSQCENPRSQCETKNNPLNQEEHFNAEKQKNSKVKKGDLMDGILAYSQTNSAEDAFIDELERGLRLTFKRNEDAYKIARRLMKETVTPSEWLDWWKSDQFRLANQTHNLTLEKIFEKWKQAERNVDFDRRKGFDL